MKTQEIKAQYDKILAEVDARLESVSGVELLSEVIELTNMSKVAELSGVARGTLYTIIRTKSFEFVDIQTKFKILAYLEIALQAPGMSEKYNPKG